VDHRKTLLFGTTAVAGHVLMLRLYAVLHKRRCEVCRAQSLVQLGVTRVGVQLFDSDNPGEKDDWMGDLNKHSEEVLTGVMITSPLQAVKPLDRFQFERLGYFCVDTDSTPSALVFNRTCALRDTYSDKR
jgi:hypothetical protein